MANWYTIHTSSGSEKRIREMILEQARKENISEYFEEVIVPIIEVPEVRRGKTVTVEKKFMPGYILIKMVMNDKSRNLINNIPKTNFLGTKSSPAILKEEEVERILSQRDSTANSANSMKLYEIGEQVVVINGPFDSFVGIVEEIDHDKQKLRVSISIFGKATPIDLNFTQIEKT